MNNSGLNTTLPRAMSITPNVSITELDPEMFDVSISSIGNQMAMALGAYGSQANIAPSAAVTNGANGITFTAPAAANNYPARDIVIPAFRLLIQSTSAGSAGTVNFTIEYNTTGDYYNAQAAVGTPVRATSTTFTVNCSADLNNEIYWVPSVSRSKREYYSPAVLRPETQTAGVGVSAGYDLTIKWTGNANLAVTAYPIHSFKQSEVNRFLRLTGLLPFVSGR